MGRHKLYRSERDMRNSMIKLMKSVPYGAITVTMIAEDACINRKTFYAHYQNKDELLFAIVYDMFDDLFSCFMYEKDSPCDILDEKQLQKDVEIFLRKVVDYRESISVLVTPETSDIVISIADQIVLNRCRDIHILNDTDGKVPQKFYLAIIRNFFMGIIDAWIESEHLSLEEGIFVLSKIMKQNYVNIFRYVRPRFKEQTPQLQP